MYGHIQYFIYINTCICSYQATAVLFFNTGPSGWRWLKWRMGRKGGRGRQGGVAHWQLHKSQIIPSLISAHLLRISWETLFFTWLYFTIPNPIAQSVCLWEVEKHLTLWYVLPDRWGGENTWEGINGWEDEESVITNYHFLPWLGKIASVIAESVEQELMGGVSLCLFLERAEWQEMNDPCIQEQSYIHCVA